MGGAGTLPAAGIATPLATAAAAPSGEVTAPPLTLIIEGLDMEIIESSPGKPFPSDAGMGRVLGASVADDATGGTAGLVDISG
jgi:hypothetical protein